MLQDLIDEFEYLKHAIDRRVDEGALPHTPRIRIAIGRVNADDGAFYDGRNRLLIADRGIRSVREATSDNVHEAMQRFAYQGITIDESLRITNNVLRPYALRE